MSDKLKNADNNRQYVSMFYGRALKDLSHSAVDVRENRKNTHWKIAKRHWFFMELIHKFGHTISSWKIFSFICKYLKSCQQKTAKISFYIMIHKHPPKLYALSFFSTFKYVNSFCIRFAFVTVSFLFLGRFESRLNRLSYFT